MARHWTVTGGLAWPLAMMYCRQVFVSPKFGGGCSHVDRAVLGRRDRAVLRIDDHPVLFRSNQFGHVAGLPGITLKRVIRRNPLALADQEKDRAGGMIGRVGIAGERNAVDRAGGSETGSSRRPALGGRIEPLASNQVTCP